jgi:hypothetical protein
MLAQHTETEDLKKRLRDRDATIRAANAQIASFQTKVQGTRVHCGVLRASTDWIDMQRVVTCWLLETLL